jgi:pilus assembly protein Flp/PilA
MTKFHFVLAYAAATLHSIERRQDEKGATAVEYGLLVALIAAVIVAVVATLGGKIGTAFSTVNSKLT